MSAVHKIFDFFFRRRAAAHADLLANYELYKSSFDEAHIGLLHTSLDGRFLMGNDAFSQILGLSTAQIKGIELGSVTHPDDRARDQDRLRRLAAGEPGVPTTWEKRYIRSNGDVVPVRLAVKIRRDAAGRPLHFLSVVTDLSETHKVQSVLHQTMNAMPLSLGYLDLDFKYVFTNNVYKTAFLGAKDEIERGNLTVAFEPQDAKRLWELRQAAKNGVPGRTTAWMTQRETGCRKLLDIKYVPHHNDSGVVIGIIVLGEDVTKQHEDEHMLADQQGRLLASAKLAALGEMSASIAHEINNPLAIIDGKTHQLRRMLRSVPELSERIEGTLGTINAMSERIARIVRGLRTLSREGSGDPYLPTPLAAIVNDSVALCGNQFKTNGTMLAVGTIPELELECRATEIVQVLLNVLGNSLDAVAACDTRWVRLEAVDRGAAVEISVTDSGPGIPQDLREKVMRPFFTTKAVGKGTGLGLSISKGIVEGHGGTLCLDARSDATRFVIVIPKLQS